MVITVDAQSRVIIADDVSFVYALLAIISVRGADIWRLHVRERREQLTDVSPGEG